MYPTTSVCIFGRGVDGHGAKAVSFFFFFFFLAIWEGLGGCERSCWWGGQGVIVLEKGFFCEVFPKVERRAGVCMWVCDYARKENPCF